MKIRLLLFLLLGIGPPAWAAGTCTVSDVTSSQNASSRVPDANTVIVTLTCTGDASTGSFPSTAIPLTGSSPSGSALNVYNLTGFYLYQVGRTPGTTNPTANYSVTVTDTQGFAIDLGLLTSNGSASAAQLTTIANSSTNYPVVRSGLTVAITGNSVASAQITLNLIFRTNVVASSLGGSSYNPSAVAITGGAIDGTSVGATTPSTGKFSTLTANGATTLNAVTDGAITVGSGASAANYLNLSGGRGFIGISSTASTIIQTSGAAKNILFASGGTFGSGSTAMAIDPTAGAVGIGSGNVSPTSDYIFWDLHGLQHQNQPAPAVSGTGCTLTNGTNAGGVIATSSSTACTVTFSSSGWNTWAACTVSASSSSALPYVSSQSKTAATFTEVSSTGNLYYVCVGN